MAKRTSMVFDFSWMDNIAGMGFRKEVLDEVMYAAVAYGRDGVLPEEMKPLTRMAMAFIAPQIDINLRRFDEKCAQLERARQARKKQGDTDNGNTDTTSANIDSMCDNTESECDNTDSMCDIAESVFGNADPTNDNTESTLRKYESRMNQTDTTLNQTDTTLTQHDTECGNTERGCDNIGSAVSNEYEYENKIINLSLPRVREELKNIFLGPISCPQYMKRWDTTREELERVCDEVLEDWIALRMEKKGMADAKSHFQGAVRYKYEQKIKNGNEKPGNGGRSARSGASSRKSREEGAYGVVHE